MRTVRLMTLALGITAPSAAMAQFASPNVTYIAPPAEDMIALVHLRRASELQVLHDQGIVMRAGDGGTLTPAHRAQLQAKLDELEATYRAQLQRYDPLIVDSLGRRR